MVVDKICQNRETVVSLFYYIAILVDALKLFVNQAHALLATLKIYKLFHIVAKPCEEHDEPNSQHQADDGCCKIKNFYIHTIIYYLVKKSINLPFCSA